jgi:hypothetical protein
MPLTLRSLAGMPLAAADEAFSVVDTLMDIT